MVRLIIFAAVLLLVALPIYCKQQETLSTENSSWNNVGDPPPRVHLDPELRRALLKALTQLERESQQQSGSTSSSSQSTGSDSAQDNIKRDLEELIGNFQGSVDTSHDGQSSVPEDQETSDIKEQEGLPPTSLPNHDDSDISQFPENVKVVEYLTDRDPKPNSSPISEKDSDDLQGGETGNTGRNNAAIFFHSSELKEVGDENREADQENDNKDKNLDIQSNVIPASQDSQLDNNGALQEESSKPKQEITKVTVQTSLSVLPTPNIDDVEKTTTKKDEDGEVSIFQAPLVAAFTLHEDERGLPQSVVPLLRPATPRPQKKKNQEPVLVLREQALAQKANLIQQQILQIQQQQLQQQQYLKQQQFLFEEQQRRQREQEFFLAEQRRLRQQQQQFEQQQRVLQPPVLSTETQSHNLRPQRQEQGTGIVDFQRSVGFQFNREQLPPPPPPQPINNNNFQSAASFLIQQRENLPLPLSTNDNSFVKQPSLSNNDNFLQPPPLQSITSNSFSPHSATTSNFIHPSPTPPTSNFLQHSSQSFSTPVSNNFVHTPTITSNGNFLHSSSQGFRPIIEPNNFFRNSQQQFPPLFQQSFSLQQAIEIPLDRGNNNIQHHNSNSNQLRSNTNNNFRQSVVNTHLQNLLYQSGIADDFHGNIKDGASSHEDLNIVSKVLALNHDGVRHTRIVRQDKATTKNDEAEKRKDDSQKASSES